jgi:hypothetical protein
MWPDIKRVWRDVELNAAKCSYGVLHCVWEPPATRPVKTGSGEDSSTEERWLEPPFVWRSIKPEEFYPVYRTYDRPDDFLYVYFQEPRRLTMDLELKYGVSIQGTGLDEGYGDNLSAGTESTTEVIAYWDRKVYALIGITKIIEVRVDPRARGYGTPPRADDFVETEHYVLLEYIEHKLDRIPFWVLQNIRNPDFDPTYQGSIADVDDIIDLNKHYNWIVSEEADEIATHIHRPIFYLSEDHQQDVSSLKFVPGAVNPIGPPGEEDVKQLEWQPEPGFVSGHLDRVLSGMKELAFLGDAGFGNLPAGVSGVAAKVALTPMEQIIELKLPQRQEILQSVCAYLLRTFEARAMETKFQGWVQLAMNRYGAVTFAATDVQGNYFVQVDYGNMLPRDDAADEQNEVYKFKTGAQALFTTLDRLNHEDPQAELDRIKREGMDPELNPERVLLIIQAKQAQRAFDLEQQAMRQQQDQSRRTGPPSAMPNQGGEAAAPPASPFGPATAPGVGTAQQGTRRVQPGPSRQEAPPVPSGAAFPGPGGGAGGAGPAAPFMRRTVAPNFNPPRPGIRQ